MYYVKNIFGSNELKINPRLALLKIKILREENNSYITLLITVCMGGKQLLYYRTYYGGGKQLLYYSTYYGGGK